MRVDGKPCCKSLKPDTSRAVRDPSNGMPTNAVVKSNWNTAYNQFHSNISKYIQNTGHSVSTEGVQSEILNHEDFDRYFNQQIPHQQDSVRKIIYGYRHADPIVASEYILISDDEDDDTDEISDFESLLQAGIPTILTPAGPADRTVIHHSTPLGK